MHAYLLVGEGDLKDHAHKLAKELGSTLLPMAVSKIEDVRELAKMTKLTAQTPTALFVPDIHKATEEALNAFLKNLEEPQENVKYILTTISFQNVLPTIVSRCQIIRIGAKEKSSSSSDSEYSAYVSATTSERLKANEKIKSKEEALEFLHNLISYLHFQLHQDGQDYNYLAMMSEYCQETHRAISMNGNVSLQMTNLVVKLSKISA